MLEPKVANMNKEQIINDTNKWLSQRSPKRFYIGYFQDQIYISKSVPIAIGRLDRMKARPAA